ncbi:hypothetical protein KP509_10G060700 [Ceratopteris richardii]|nr:hypothetical protein KP509_10G060700 [Ceratopteris richardii]
MDPKMDAGMAGSGVATLDDAIQSGKAPINLTIAQLIDVMDHLLACEASWHKGHSLSQTVFSCLYLLDVERTSSNALLHSYCRTVRALCSLTRTAVSSVHSNEEEDLFIAAFGLPLEVEGDGKCLSKLNAVEEGVNRQLKGAKGLAIKRKPAEEVEPLQEDPALEEGYCRAILCRLRFRKAFYHIVTNMTKPQGRGLDMAQKYIAVALSEMKNIQKSADFLSHCADGIAQNEKTTASGREPIGFDPKVNRSVSAPTPPRSINLLTWEETTQYFIKLLGDLEIITSLTTSLSLEELFQVLVDFQKRDPDLIARSFLQLFLVQEEKLFGKDSMFDVLHKTFSLSETVKSDMLMSDSFVVKSGQLTLYLVRILCSNLSWQHRKLGKILSEWGILLQQGDALFENLMHGTLATLEDKESWESAIMGWTAEQTCWICAQILTLGFQLQLYAPSEYCMIYWYLDHALLTELNYRHLKERKNPTNNEPSDQTNKKKKRSKRKGSMKVTEEELQLTPQTLLLQCYIDACKGLSWMMAALTADGKFSESRQTIFNTEHERFIQRFDLFQKVPIPQPLSYMHYKSFTVQRNISIKEQYLWSREYFATLQQHLQDLGHCLAKSTNLSPICHSQRTTEINQLKQVASRNLIVLRILNDAERGKTLNVSFDFSQHPFFAVASVKKV